MKLMLPLRRSHDEGAEAVKDEDEEEAEEDEEAEAEEGSSVRSMFSTSSIDATT
jgi:hypothetical protein